MLLLTIRLIITSFVRVLVSTILKLFKIAINQISKKLTLCTIFWLYRQKFCVFTLRTLFLSNSSYADQPRAHKVCIISLESEHIKLTCIDNL